MMWRLLAKNSVITCSTMGGSEEVVAIVICSWRDDAKSKKLVKFGATGGQEEDGKCQNSESVVILEPLRQQAGKQNSRILGGLGLRFDLWFGSLEQESEATRSNPMKSEGSQNRA